MTEKARVFVSSVMDGYEDMRAAARAGIASAGCEPVLIEDLGAQAESSRNTCLGVVGSCDAIVVIVGARGGFRAPSGRLVVEEEYEHARGLSMPTLVFLQDTARDPDATALAKRLSDYVHGSYRQTFVAEDELAIAVEEACSRLAAPVGGAPMDTKPLDTLLDATPSIGGEVVLRIVVLPGRCNETVFDLDWLDDESGRQEIVAMGVARDSGLFHRNERRSESRGNNSLIVTQSDDRRSEAGRFVRAELCESGVIVIDTAVTGTGDAPAPGSLAALGVGPIVVEDVEEHARRALAFARAVYEKADPYGRHVGLLCNASVGGLAGRPVVFRASNPHTGASMSWTVGDRQSERPRSFDRPQTISRADAGWVEKIAQKMARRLERRTNT